MHKQVQFLNSLFVAGSPDGINPQWKQLTSLVYVDPASWQH